MEHVFAKGLPGAQFCARVALLPCSGVRSLHRDPDFLLHHQQARQSGVPGFSGPSCQPRLSSLKWLWADNAICAAWDAGSVRFTSVLLMRIVSFVAPDA